MKPTRKLTIFVLIFFIVVQVGCTAFPHNEQTAPVPFHGNLLESIKTMSEEEFLNYTFSPEQLSLKDDKNNNLLHLAVRYNSDNGVAQKLLEKGLNPNEKNVYGYTPFHFILAVGSYSLNKTAISYGADPRINVQGLNVYQLAKAINGFGGQGGLVKRVEFNQFAVGAELKSYKGNSDNSPELANDLIPKFALAKSQAFMLAKLSSLAYQKIENDFEREKANAEHLKEKYSKSPSVIVPPEIIPYGPADKSPFENNQMYRNRLVNEKDAYEAEKAGLLSVYSQRVLARERKIERNKIDLERVLSEFMHKKSLYEEQKFAFVKKAETAQKSKRSQFYAESVASVYGAPVLMNCYEGDQPAYNAETGLMTAGLFFSGLNKYYQVGFSVPPGENAKDFFYQLEYQGINPDVIFEFDRDRTHFLMNKVSVKQKDIIYTGEFVAPELKYRCMNPGV